MAGSVNLASNKDANGDAVDYVLEYDDQLRATSFSGVNNTQQQVSGKIIGWAADGTEDPNKTFGLILTPGQADHVDIPLTGPKAIQLSISTRTGKPSGYNSYL